jgi:hypothetical protein
VAAAFAREPIRAALSDFARSGDATRPWGDCSSHKKRQRQQAERQQAVKQLLDG